MDFHGITVDHYHMLMVDGCVITVYGCCVITVDGCCGITVDDYQVSVAEKGETGKLPYLSVMS